ncbi:MAG: hypothetical protein RL754_260 [Bacteroidota bacterium]|jgi:stage II sporulation protein D
MPRFYLKTIGFLAVMLTSYSLNASGLISNFTGPRILIFAEDFNTKIQCKVLTGSYKLIAYTPDSIFEMDYGREDVHPTYTFDGDLRINKAEADSIKIIPSDTIVVRARKEASGWTEERFYTGTLLLRNGLLYVDAIVQVPVRDYITGVCEAEGGLSAAQSYHEAQAVLARTWLYTNLDKHNKEGYHIKDDQSSQAFRGVAHGKNKDIIARAVERVGDTIAVYDGKPIIGFYHSNSGGKTVLPQHVWSQELPYCREVTDPFAQKGTKFSWTKRIAFVDWQNYWLKQEVQFSVAQWRSFAEERPVDRETYWTIEDKTFKLETVRRNFKLRSTYFTMDVQNDYIELHGRGFGHGVGMAQEGAMYMAESGFDWREILNFYFKQLEFVPVSELSKS